MTKLAFTSLLLVFLPWPSTGQSSIDPALNDLAWNEFYKLQWDDFQGEPDEDSRGDAGAAVAIRAKPFLVRKKIKYDVVAVFNRGRSWARDRSASLLAHEQLHFDIAELYARKIRQRVAALSDRGVNDIDVYNKAVQALLLESNDADRRYDIETLHGALPKRQAEWADKVKEGLAELKKYRKVKRVIGRP